jgi:hypothetical protein
MSLKQAREKDIRVEDAGSQIGFALGLKLAKQTGMLCALQSFQSDLLCSPVVIKELPCNSLTKLHLCGEGIDPDKCGWPPAVMGAAIGALTSLRSLILGPPGKFLMPGAYLSFISSLSQLTQLGAIHMESGDTFPYLALLPHSLAALQVVVGGTTIRTDPLDSLIHLDLAHLSSLTALTFIAPLSSSSRLPPSVVRLALQWQRDSTISLVLQLPRLNSLILEPGQGINLESITKHTTLTHLELMLVGSDPINAAAPYWAQLPSLHRLDMEYDSKPQMIPSRRLFSPAFFSHLGAATSLTSLRLCWAANDDNLLFHDNLEGFSEQLAKLKQLCCLSLSCLPLGLSAHHLSNLTHLTSLELCSCRIQSFVVVALCCKLKKLQHLSLESNHGVSDSCTPALGQLTQLSTLKLQGTSIERLGLMQLTTLRQTQNLQLSVGNHMPLSFEDIYHFWDAMRAGRGAVGA